MLAQFCPVVKPIAGDLAGIRLVCFHFAQGVISVVLDELRIDCTDEDALIMKKAGYWLIVPPGMLHDYPRLAVQAFQVVCQLLEFTAGVTNRKRFCHHFPKGTENGYHTFPFGNINPCHIVHVNRSSSWICFGDQPFHHCRSNLFDDTGALMWPTTCINRTLRMRGWMTDFLTDAMVLGGIHQAKTLPF